jgi:hypothetical protein
LAGTQQQRQNKQQAVHAGKSGKFELAALYRSGSGGRSFVFINGILADAINKKHRSDAASVFAKCLSEIQA